MTVSHVIVILSVLPCQLSPKSNSHISLPLLHLYKYQCVLQCDHSDLQLVQQRIQISTRINSTSVHMYICVCFIRNVSNIQHDVRIEAVATSLQEGESTDQIQQFPAYFQAS